PTISASISSARSAAAIRRGFTGLWSAASRSVFNIPRRSFGGQWKRRHSRSFQFFWNDSETRSVVGTRLRRASACLFSSARIRAKTAHQIDALRDEDEQVQARHHERSELAERFEQVASLHSSIEIEAVWEAATTTE